MGSFQHDLRVPKHVAWRFPHTSYTGIHRSGKKNVMHPQWPSNDSDGKSFSPILTQACQRFSVIPVRGLDFPTGLIWKIHLLLKGRVQNGKMSFHLKQHMQCPAGSLHSHGSPDTHISTSVLQVWPRYFRYRLPNRNSSIVMWQRREQRPLIQSYSFHKSYGEGSWWFTAEAKLCCLTHFEERHSRSSLNKNQRFVTRNRDVSQCVIRVKPSAQISRTGGLAMARRGGTQASELRCSVHVSDLGIPSGSSYS